MSNKDKQIGSGSGSGSGSGGNQRTYDCTTCKRGFTNPQALGGHNNLHRDKRRDFIKPNNFPFSIPSPSISSPLDFPNPNYNTLPPYFPTFESHPPINPNYNFGSSSSSSTGSEGGRNHAQGEFLGLDLSLGLGSMNVNLDTHRRPPSSQPEHDDLDLDLDLRLGGHHHH